jgi:LmbE family N-acetylglucosaminyl deacetylase
VTSVLVVAAHPDDEVLGCGGTIARRVADGWTAHLLVLATGATSRYADRADPAAIAEIADLRADLNAAAAVIGFSSVERLDFPDNELDTVSRSTLARAVDDVLERLRPDHVLTHHPGDYNWDHTRSFDAVMMAARSSPNEYSPDEIWAFEVPSSTERAWQAPDRAFHPSVFVDVAATIETKRRALACYRSEARPYPHPRSPEGLEYLARKRGLEVGVTHAEAFELVRRIER